MAEAGSPTGSMMSGTTVGSTPAGTHKIYCARNESSHIDPYLVPTQAETPNAWKIINFKRPSFVLDSSDPKVTATIPAQLVIDMTEEVVKIQLNSFLPKKAQTHDGRIAYLKDMPSGLHMILHDNRTNNSIVRQYLGFDDMTPYQSFVYHHSKFKYN